MLGRMAETSNAEQRSIQAAGAEMAFNYAREIFMGAAHGVVVLANDVLHPINNVLSPIASVLYDATIITAAHIDSVSSNHHEFSDFSIARQAVEMNPQLYHDAVSRMQERKNGLQAQGQQFANATGPEKAGMISQVVSTVLVPGKFVDAVKAVGNLHKFGIPYSPPRFHNYMKDVPAGNVTGLNLSDIRAIPGTKAYLYVITEDRRLTIAGTRFSEPVQRINQFGCVSKEIIVHHHDIARLSPVLNAGEIMVENGLIKSITNSSGHFLPEGRHLNKMTEKIFARNGYHEAIGKYSNINVFGFLGKSPAVSTTPASSSLFSSVANAGGVTAVIAEGLKSQLGKCSIKKQESSRQPSQRFFSSTSKERNLGLASGNIKGSSNAQSSAILPRQKTQATTNLLALYSEMQQRQLEPLTPSQPPDISRLQRNLELLGSSRNSEPAMFSYSSSTAPMMDNLRQLKNSQQAFTSCLSKTQCNDLSQFIRHGELPTHYFSTIAEANYYNTFYPNYGIFCKKPDPVAKTSFFTNEGNYHDDRGGKTAFCDSLGNCYSSLSECRDSGASICTSTLSNSTF